MNEIIKKQNINGPIGVLFSRSQVLKKNSESNYSMSASVPNIKLVTEESVRPVVKLDNNVRINDINLVKDDDKDSVSSGSTVEAKPVESKKNLGKIKPSLKTKSKFNPEDYQNFVNNSKTKDRKKDESSDDESECDSESSSLSGRVSLSDHYSDVST